LSFDHVNYQYKKKALLYCGTIDNPNFWWGEDGQGYDIDAAARIIATTVGPSGPNVDYLRNLSGFLKSMESVDTHVLELETRVEAILLSEKQS
jgi:cation transport regulator ChaC